MTIRAALIACASAFLPGCNEARFVPPHRQVPTAPPTVVASVRPAPPPAPALPPVDAPKARCPDGMVQVDAFLPRSGPVGPSLGQGPRANVSPPPAARSWHHRFCIDRHEAHLVRRVADGRTERHPHVQRPEEGVVYEARSEPGVFPQAYVSRIEAQAACVNAGKRLCSMREWRRACQGHRGTTYPYAEAFEPDRCNTGKAHLLSLRFGPDPRGWRYEDFNDPALGRVAGFLARTGAHGLCVSEEGVHDLVGNVHEWVDDTVDPALVGRLEAEGGARAYQPWRTGHGVFVGGFFSTQSEHGPGCRFTTVAHEPRYHDYSTGFRC